MNSSDRFTNLENRIMNFVNLLIMISFWTGKLRKKNFLGPIRSLFSFSTAKISGKNSESNWWKHLLSSLFDSKSKCYSPQFHEFQILNPHFFFNLPICCFDKKKKKLYSSNLIKNLRNYEVQNSRNSWNHSVKSSLFSPYYFYIDVTKYIEFGIHQIR